MKKSLFNCVERIKKHLTMLGLVLCCAMAATVLTACGSDYDNDGGSQKDTNAVTAKLDIPITVSEDLLQYCDINVEYNLGTEVKKEQITKSSWTKTLQASIPTKVEIKITASLKADADTSTDTANKNFSIKCKPSCFLLNAAGEQLRELFVPSTSTMSDNENIDATSIINGQTYELELSGPIDANGTSTTYNWSKSYAEQNH